MNGEVSPEDFSESARRRDDFRICLRFTLTIIEEIIAGSVESARPAGWLICFFTGRGTGSGILLLSVCSRRAAEKMHFPAATLFVKMRSSGPQATPNAKTK
ncbi:MAG: hypothetical protein ACLVJH_17955 [Faecalibacterium prausnitzii]